MKSFTRTRTETFTPLWVKVDFSTYGEEWIGIRANMRYKADNCFKCHKHFQMGDTIGLACFKEKGNKVLCKQCAEELE
jgi:hypothetical protein